MISVALIHTTDTAAVKPGGVLFGAAEYLRYCHGLCPFEEEGGTERRQINPSASGISSASDH